MKQLADVHISYIFVSWTCTCCSDVLSEGPKWQTASSIMHNHTEKWRLHAYFSVCGLHPLLLVLLFVTRRVDISFWFVTFLQLSCFKSENEWPTKLISLSIKSLSSFLSAAHPSNVITLMIYTNKLSVNNGGHFNGRLLSKLKHQPNLLCCILLNYINTDQFTMKSCREVQRNVWLITKYNILEALFITSISSLYNRSCH